MENMEVKYPIEIKQAWPTLFTAGRILLLAGIPSLLMAGSESSHFMIFLSFFLIIMSIFVIVVALGGIHCILLKIDEKEIGYFPFRKKGSKVIQWGEASEFKIYSVYA